MDRNKHGLCLLSLDGGGVRGLSTLYILQRLMKKINLERGKAGLAPAKPCEVFDLIGGTSTGGLIAIMLGRLEMNVESCIDAYTQLMEDVFSRRSRRIDWHFNVKGQFSSKELEKAIKSMIPEEQDPEKALLYDDRANDRPCKAFVCAIRKNQKSLVRLRSYDSEALVEENITIWQAGRATSAATSFFDPITIGKGHQVREYVDGALGFNNPLDEVWAEAQDIWAPDDGKLDPMLKCIVSIGTGNPGISAVGNNPLTILETLKQIATQTENTERVFAMNHRDLLGRERRYFRFNVEQGLQDIGLEEYERHGDITGATMAYLNDHQMIREYFQDCALNLSCKEFWVGNKTDYRKRYFSSPGPFLNEIKVELKFPNTDLTNQISLNYIARPLLTQELERILSWDMEAQQGPRTVLIHGHAGFGKTQLVRDYARTQVQNGVAFRWLDASTLGTLRASILDFARETVLSDSQSRLSKQNPARDSIQGDIQKALRFIGTLQQKWLLVYDNYDMIEDEIFDLRSYFPGGNQGSIIVTSRNRGVATDIGASCLLVESMSSQESVELLKKTAKVVELNAGTQAQTLQTEIAVQLLGRHPLAIAQAGAYIRNRIVPQTLPLEERLLRYKKSFIAREAEMLKGDKVTIVKEYGLAVITSWDLSFQTIVKQNPTAAELFLFLGFMHHTSIPQQIFAKAHKSLEKLSREDGITIEDKQYAWLQAILVSDEVSQWDSGVLEDCLGLLESYSLIRVTDGPNYNIHPLVHTWTRVGKNIMAFNLEARARLALVLLSYVYEKTDDWTSPKRDAMHRKFINHLENCIRFTQKNTKLLEIQTEPKLRAKCLISLTRFIDGQALNWELKTQQLETRLSVLAIYNGSKLDGLDYPSTMAGFVYLLLALNEYRQYTDISEEVSQVLLNLASRSARREEDVSIAEIHLSFMFVRINSISKSSKRQTILAGCDEAVAWADSHQHQMSRSYYLTRKVVLLCLSEIYSFDLGESLLQKRLLCLKTLLPEVEEELGENSFSKWYLMTFIAKIIKSLGNEAEAASIFRLVLRNCETLPGDMRNVLNIATHSLSLILLKQKAYGELIDNYRSLKARLTKYLGPFHVDTLWAANNELNWESILLQGDDLPKRPEVFSKLERGSSLDEHISLGLENAIAYKSLNRNDQISELWDGLTEYARLSSKSEALFQSFIDALEAAADAGIRQGYDYIAFILQKSAKTIRARESEGSAKESKVVQLERLRQLWDRIIALHEAADRSNFSKSVQIGDEIWAKIKYAPSQGQPMMIWLAAHYINWLFMLEDATKVSPISYRVLGHIQRLTSIHFGANNLLTYRVMGSLAVSYRISGKFTPALQIEDHLIEKRIRENIDHAIEIRSGLALPENIVAALSLEALIIEYKRRRWYSEIIRIFEPIIVSFTKNFGIEAKESMNYISFVFELYGRLGLDEKIDDLLKEVLKSFQNGNGPKRQIIYSQMFSVAAWCFATEQFAATYRVLCWMVGYCSLSLNLSSRITLLGDLETVTRKLGRIDSAKKCSEAKVVIEQRRAGLS